MWSMVMEVLCCSVVSLGNFSLMILMTGWMGTDVEKCSNIIGDDAFSLLQPCFLNLFHKVPGVLDMMCGYNICHKGNNICHSYPTYMAITSATPIQPIWQYNICHGNNISQKWLFHLPLHIISTVSHMVFHHSHGQISLIQWDNNICPYIYMAITSANICDFLLSQNNQLPLKLGGLHQPP